MYNLQNYNYKNCQKLKVNDLVRNFISEITNSEYKNLFLWEMHIEILHSDSGDIEF